MLARLCSDGLPRTVETALHVTSHQLTCAEYVLSVLQIEGLRIERQNWNHPDRQLDFVLYHSFWPEVNSQAQFENKNKMILQWFHHI